MTEEDEAKDVTVDDVMTIEQLKWIDSKIVPVLGFINTAKLPRVVLNLAFQYMLDADPHQKTLSLMWSFDRQEYIQHLIAAYNESQKGSENAVEPSESGEQAPSEMERQAVDDGDRGEDVRDRTVDAEPDVRPHAHIPVDKID